LTILSVTKTSYIGLSEALILANYSTLQ
jgi:hypothetical protein